MPRIIAGERRGRIIRTLQGRNTRPTSDRVKESLFNIIQERLQSSRVLDLYAGTGSLGLESLSRGCRDVVFVENDPSAVRFYATTAVLWTIWNTVRYSLLMCKKP